MAETTIRPLVSAGSVMGIGLGGFVDGIVFHQLLQIHNMLSAKFPKNTIVNVEVNMFWDGLFHAFTWVMVAVGVRMLWIAARRADVPWLGKVFFGGLLLGWGIFNLVEGVIDHHLLQIHHVFEAAGVSIWDWLFLGSGLALILGGTALIKCGQPVAVPQRP
jgi:uncharacterized membrane protein